MRYRFYKGSAIKNYYSSTQIIFENENNIEYLYNAVGQKVRKSVKTGEEFANTDYLGGFQYRSSYTSAQGDQSTAELQYFPHAEGYVQQIDGQFFYIYHYTDHLGNIRLSYTYDYENGMIKIMEENHYYPFGLKHDSYNTNRLGYSSYIDEEEITHIVLGEMPKFVGDGSYNYKFGQKELQDELGLNVYDFEARYYMPDIGRTTTYDPLAEMFYDLSPQSFFNNNPIYFVDPTGMAADGWITQEVDGVKTHSFDANVNTVAEAEAAGYENVEQVRSAINISASDGSYSYNLNENGSVTNASDGSSVQMQCNRAYGNMKYGGAMETALGSKIYSNATIAPFQPASGAITPMNFTSPFFSWGWAAKGLGALWGAAFGTSATTSAPAMTTVGRWMSSAEYNAMSTTGQMIEGAGGQTFVTTGGASSFSAAAKGSVYAEFQVSTNSLLQGGQANWFKTIGPSAGNAMQSALTKQGGQVLPPIQNLSPILKVK